MKARLLIIDDTPANIHVLLEGLKDSYSITAATRGDRGLELARQSPPDLILLDVVMDGMDGYQVLEALRQDVRTSAVPVIFVTAQTDEKDEARGLALGALDYITKPFRINIVRARIQNHLELKSHRDRLEQMVQEQVREMLNSHITTIFAMSKLAESRDDETGTHLERTRQYCRLLATHLKESGSYPELIDADFVHRIFQASPLHDIGKVAIPDGILKKPGKLTQEEFEIMKTHTLRGAETLASVTQVHPHNEFLKFGLEIARSHHEKWDGSGYPDQLMGTQIPLAARIMAVADVYDALTSKRCYKDAMSHQEALEIIQSQSGFHFEPALVDALLAVQARFMEVLQGYRGES
ncbi:response regulator [bacterium]|nr:response regulator [bacterium]